jgi:hypothetical protein
MEDPAAGAVLVVVAVHDKVATRGKHTLQGRKAVKALTKGRDAHVFNDGIDLTALEARVWNEGTYLGKVGEDHRLEYERFIWCSPVPIGRRIQTGTVDLPLNWVEIKGKMKQGMWLYHLTPRRRPPA